MTLDEIIVILDAFVREKFSIEPDDEDYSVNVHLFDYGYLDSIGTTEILLFAEQRFGTEITHKDIMLYPMNTVAEISEVIFRKMREK